MGLINTWKDFLNKFNDAGFILSFVISVISFFALYHFVMHVLRKNNASSLIYIMTVVIVLAGIIFLFDSNLIGVFFLIFPIAFVIIVINLFSVEIKRSIWTRNNRTSTEKKSDTVFDEEIINKSVDEIIKALQDMAKNDVGALIVLSSANVPSQVLDSGVRLMSDISSELIESVFFPKTPLHDGAMIINGTKIIAAGCFLPLSQNIDNISKDLGTRHRAGMGITENIDVISLIVSEETGIISIAKGGSLTRFADAGMLKKTLTEYYWQDINGGKR